MLCHKRNVHRLRALIRLSLYRCSVSNPRCDGAHCAEQVPRIDQCTILFSQVFQFAVIQDRLRARRGRHRGGR